MAVPPALADRLARLAPDQHAAATCPPGPVLCVAPAGSGKTTTLVARIAWLIAGPVAADAATVCAVTFNRRAAAELRARLNIALGPLDVEPGTVRVRTFHALGREILAGDGVDVTKMVDRSEVVARLFPDAPPHVRRRLDDAFSRLKLDLRVDPRSEAPDGFDRRLFGAYAAYQEHLRESHALDFDDLVVGALEHLRAEAGLLGHWQARCAHLLVDEVQDVDRTQLDLAILLAGASRRIFLVGDDDQTIYAWRLADVRRVIGLAARLPGLRRVDLEVNYRCPAPVVERAVRLVARNRERFRKTIRARSDAPGRLLLARVPTDDATRARRLLRRWLDEGLPRAPDRADGARWAVLARTNAELAPFAASALELGIAFSAEEHRLLLEDPRIDPLLGADGPVADDAATLPALGRLPAGPDSEPIRSALLAWAAPYPTLGSFRGALRAARAALGRLHRDDASLVLATAHGTKGLEFDHVAVVGLDEGRFPSRRSLEESEDPARALEEERRLAYVAWTRAKRSLTLVYDPGAPSPFLRETFAREELGLLD